MSYYKEMRSLNLNSADNCGVKPFYFYNLVKQWTCVLDLNLYHPLDQGILNWDLKGLQGVRRTLRNHLFNSKFVKTNFFFNFF